LTHLDLKATGEGIQADIMTVGAFDGASVAVRCQIETDPQWRTRRLVVETTDGRGFTVQSDGEGHWRERDGKPIPALDGCMDVDLQGSPFTNMLPIRRLNIDSTMGTLAFSMLNVPFDSFEPYAVAQLYTCLEDGRLYRYENADGSFTADLPLDEDGLVLDYPELFERETR